MYQILFWNDTVHVSDGLSFHHQEFKTVHTATGICQTDTAVASRQCVCLNVKTLSTYVPDSVVSIILTFHEARLTSLVCQCDCIYCASVTIFTVPV